MTDKVWAALADMEFLDRNDRWGSPEYDQAARDAWSLINGAHREVLTQLLFDGPVWDGDIISKVHRDDLIRWGLATRCCFKGQQGYTAATYVAFTVRKRGTGSEKRNG